MKNVSRGVNDFSSIFPQYMPYLKDKDDGYKHTPHSNKSVWWKCPDCGHEFKQSFNKFVSKLNKCPACSDTASYAVKFLCCVFNQLSVPFQMEKGFDWLPRRRYDFWLPEQDVIIEIHGKQHYSMSDPWNSDGKQKYIDLMKEEKAYENGYTGRYIVLMYDVSGDGSRFVTQILGSNLQTMFSMENVDWSACNQYAILSNSVKEVCDIYNSGVVDLTQICRMTHYSSLNTIREKLKKGALLGWCDYSAAVALQNAHRKSGDHVLATMCNSVVCFDLDGNKLCTYPSLQEAQRRCGISHIWECCVGRRETAGGFRWMYEKDCIVRGEC